MIRRFQTYFSRLPVRAKLVSIMVGITAVALLIAFSTSLLFNWKAERARAMGRLQMMGEVIALQSAAPLQFLDAQAARENLQSLGIDQYIVQACVYDELGKEFAAFKPQHSSQVRCPPPASAGTRIYNWKDLEIFLPIRYAGERLGSLYIHYNLSDVYQILGYQAGYKAVIFILVLLLIWPLSTLLQRLISEPITQLACLSRRFAYEQQEPQQATKRSEDEIGDLVDAYNNMTAEIYRKKMQLEEANRNLRAARDRAEAANCAKSDFMANISHEIRTPMNAVVGLTHVLSMSEPLTEQQREFIKTLTASAGNLLVVINDLLDFTKIEQHAVELEKASFDLADAMQETVNLHRPKAEEKKLILALDYQLPGRKWVGDVHRIQQVVGNLISNAIKFTAKGSIVLSVEHPPEKESGVILRVTDTGIGIKPDFLPTLFEKFTQADASVTRQYGGSGLGLAICKGLVEQMRGSIEVKSEYGRGTEFIVFLPLEPASVEASPPALIATVDAKKGCGRVLLVEDYAANVLVAQTIIENLGYHCDVASNGLQALEKTRATSYDMVLMDVQMQGMDGLEAARRIREREKIMHAPPLPIIAMTAHATVQDRQRCLDAGMDDYLSKPFQPHELKDMLERYCFALQHTA